MTESIDDTRRLDGIHGVIHAMDPLLELYIYSRVMRNESAQVLMILQSKVHDASS